MKKGPENHSSKKKKKRKKNCTVFHYGSFFKEFQRVLLIFFFSLSLPLSSNLRVPSFLQDQDREKKKSDGRIQDEREAREWIMGGGDTHQEFSPSSDRNLANER